MEEVGRKRRSRVYGGHIYGSIHWLDEDTVTNPREKIEESVGTTDPFNRLPGELITRHMFDKIPDSKCLLNCSLVSKRFASLVPGTRAVSLEIPSWRPVCSCHGNRRLSFSSWLGELLVLLSRPFRFVWSLLRHPFRQTAVVHYIHCPNAVWFKPPAIRKFLKNFSCVESLDINLSFSGIFNRPRIEPLIRWRFDKLGFIFVCAKSRDMLSDDDGEIGDENVIGLAVVEAFDKLGSVRDHFLDALWRVVFVDSVIEDFPHLKNVIVTDCMKQGQVVLDEEKIAEIREDKNPFDGEAQGCIKVWHLPVVKLPLSGFVMNEATLCIFKDAGIDDGLLVENAFEEKEYCELARTMVNKGSFYELKVSASHVDGRFNFNVGPG